MKIKQSNYPLLIGCLLFIFTPVRAIELASDTLPLDFDAAAYQFEKIKGHDQLNITINDMVSDNKGFLWLATQNGLLRRDAYDIKQWTSNNTDSTQPTENMLAGNFVTSLAFDSDSNTLWIGTRSGLSAFDLINEQFQTFRHDAKNESSLSHDYINTLHLDARKRLWIGTQNGLNVYSGDEFVRFYQQQDDERSLSHNTILDFEEDDEGRIFIATEKGLVIYSDKTFKRIFPLKQRNKASRPIMNLAISSHYLWMSTEQNGVLRLNLNNQSIENFTTSNHNFSIPSNHVTSLLTDHKGDLWVGTAQGLARFDHNNQQFLRFVHLPEMNNMISSLYQSKNKTVWIGSWSNGLFFHHADSIQIGKISPSVLGDNLNILKTMATETTDVFWSTNPEYAFRFDLRNHQVEKYTLTSINPNQSRALPIVNKHTNRTYLLTDTLYEFVGKNQFEKNTLPASLNDILWYTGYFDSYNRLWLSSRSVGTYVISADLSSIIQHFKTPIVTSFNQVNDDTLLFGSNAEMYWVNLKTLEVIRYQPNFSADLSNTNVTGFLKDSQSKQWVATSDGLLLVYGNHPSRLAFQKISKKSNFPTQVLTGPIEDQQSFLWLGSVDGLIRFHPETMNVEHITTDRGALPQYYIGLYFKDYKGRLFFQGPDGISVISISESESATIKNPHHVAISDFLLRSAKPSESRAALNKKSPVYSDRITIPKNSRDFTLKFTVTSKPHRSALNYYYRMKGYQEEWQRTQLNNRFINFTNLTPGDYQFQIYSVTDNNQVSDVTRVDIKVEPKWFESILFHLVIGLFIVLLLVALHRVRVLSISQSKKRLEDEIHRKTQQFEVLAKMGHDVSAIQSVNDLLTQLSVHLSETISFSQIALGVCDFSEGTIKIHKASANKKLKVPYTIEIDPHKELAAWCVRNNKMVHLNHYSDRRLIMEEASDTDKDSNMQSILYFPLVSRHEQVFGCISIQHEHPSAYSEREIDFISAVSNYAGIALDNTLAHRQFEQMKVTDPITGLINKPSFLSISDYQIKMCKRLSLPVSLIIADIDKFAQLNDQFGFKAGDKILRDLSTFLSEILRAQDLLARFEGTHFVILAPNTDALGAELLTYRIQKLLESKSFSSDQHAIALTLTFGVCEYEHRHSINQNIDRAEQALLKAKERGGNDTIIYSSLLRED